MSGSDFKNAKGMDIDGNEVIKWFNKKNIKVIDEIKNDNYIYNRCSKANRQYSRRVRNENININGNV